MDGQPDLPGYSVNQETEALGLLATQNYLVRTGFKVMEVTGRFDDGLDLLVAPHSETNVLPAIAGIQVRSGPSHHGLRVGRHERYWRDMNLPVFGVVFMDPISIPPVAMWCDAQAYLRAHSNVATIPTPNPFPEGFADAIHAANEGQRGITTALDVFHSDWGRQAGAVAALAPLTADSRVAEMLRLRLGELGPRATNYALHLLVYAEMEGVNTKVATEGVAAAIDVLHESDVDGYFDIDSFQDGTEAAYHLFQICDISPAEILNVAMQSHASETTVMLIAMAVSLADQDGELILREALRRRPNLQESPDIYGIAQSLSEGGYDFGW